jgi:hypothetical protein
MLPPVDIAYIAEELIRHSEELVEAFEDQGGDTDSDPRLLLQALNDLLDGLRLHEDEDEAPPPLSAVAGAATAITDIRTLGDHGIDLLSRLAVLAGRLRLPQRSRSIEELALPLACWIARRGGELGFLGPVVNGAASVANSLSGPTELGQLYGQLTEIVNAVSPRISQDTASTDPTRPWRVLLLNRAIVATRSHEPILMEEAFESLVEHLPDEAPGFFREGMEQMDALGYPPRVRALMRRYYDQWCGQRVLH